MTTTRRIRIAGLGEKYALAAAGSAVAADASADAAAASATAADASADAAAATAAAFDAHAADVTEAFDEHAEDVEAALTVHGGTLQNALSAHAGTLETELGEIRDAAADSASAAATSATEAETAAALAVDLSNIDVPDELVSTLVGDTVTPSETRRSLDAVVERRVGGQGFTPFAGGTLAGFDSFKRPDQTTIQFTGSGGVYSDAGRKWRVTHTASLHPLTAKTYAPIPGGNVAAIAMDDHTTPYDSIAASFIFMAEDEGTTLGHNAVIGSCARFFGTNGYGGSIQLAVWPEPIGSPEYQWQLFAVEDPVSDPYPTIAKGMFRDGFEIVRDGVEVTNEGDTYTAGTEYAMSMRRNDDTHVTITLPDGQVLTFESDHVSRWGLAAGYQMRRQDDTDGYLRFTNTSTASTPDVESPLNLPALPAGQRLYFPGDDDSYVTSNNIAGSGTSRTIVAYVAPDVTDAGGVLASKWTVAKRGWYLKQSTTGSGRWIYEHTTDGTALTGVTAQATDNIPYGDGDGYWLRLHHNFTTGEVTYETSADAPETAVDDVTWSALGATVSIAAGDTVDTSDLPLRISGLSTTVPNGFAGEVYLFHLYRGGGLIFDFNPYQESFTGYDSSGNAITLTGSWEWHFSAEATLDAPVVEAFTTPGDTTWSKPAGAVRVDVICIGGGAGGGSGRRGAAGSVRTGGAGGGGAISARTSFLASELASSVPLTVGAGGPGGAAVTTDDTSGNAGTAGGRSTFSIGPCLLYAHGGNAGAAGGTAAATGGTAAAPGGSAGAASSGSGAFGSSANGQTGRGTVLTGGGGGSGGGITSGNVDSAGGSGSAGASVTPTAPVAGTASTGVAGEAGAAGSLSRIPGGGGAGGGSNSTGAAGAGGAGGAPGGAGGGGGASLNGFASGAGGAGGDGAVYVITYFA